MDAPAPVGAWARTGLKCAAVQECSLPHARQAPAVGERGGRTATAGVGDGERDGAAGLVGEVDLGGGVGARVLEGVGEGFLDDAVERELTARGECCVAP